VKSHPLEISKTLARFSSVTTDRAQPTSAKRDFRGLHTYRLSVISEKKKVKEPISSCHSVFLALIMRSPVLRQHRCYRLLAASQGVFR
jgi:hypothetical protein